MKSFITRGKIYWHLYFYGDNNMGYESTFSMTWIWMDLLNTYNRISSKEDKKYILEMTKYILGTISKEHTQQAFNDPLILINNV